MALAELGLPTYRTAPLGTSYVARARKDHECALCGYVIPKGDYHWTWKLTPWLWDGDWWFVGHAHAICIAVYDASDAHDPHAPLPDAGWFRQILADEQNFERPVEIQAGRAA